MSAYWEKGYELWPDVIDSQTQTLLRTQIDIFRSAMEYGDRMSGRTDSNYGDALVEANCWSTYGFVAFEALMKMLTPQVSQRLGLELAPSYTYMRYYYPGAVMKRHIDRPSCEVSMTLTLTCDGSPWPIGIRDLEGTEHLVQIEPRCGMLYQGTRCEHWRNSYDSGSEQVQVFLHWVDPKGANAGYVMDGRPLLAVSPDLKRTRLA